MAKPQSEATASNGVGDALTNDDSARKKRAREAKQRQRSKKKNASKRQRNHRISSRDSKARKTTKNSKKVSEKINEMEQNRNRIKQFRSSQASAFANIDTDLPSVGESVVGVKLQVASESEKRRSFDEFENRMNE
jgi:seryl-tRNA synthetase